MHLMGANLFHWAEGRTDGRTEDRENDEIRYRLSQLFDRFSKSWLYIYIIIIKLLNSVLPAIERTRKYTFLLNGHLDHRLSP